MRHAPKVMVCVTRQKNCERLIRFGHQIAAEEGLEMFVIHVAKTGTNFLNDADESSALEHLYQISKNVGAEMTVLRSDNVGKTLVESARENNVSTIIMGQSPGDQGSSIIRQVEKRLKGVEVRQVPAE